MEHFKSKNRVFVFIVVLLISFFSPLSHVVAHARDYKISEYIINVDVRPDGSADIEEYVTYDFRGKFNGVYRDVDFSETDGISNAKVFVEKSGERTESELYSTDYVNDGQTNGTHNMVIIGNTVAFKVFEKSSSETKTFIYKYTLDNVVTKYNDIAEFNRKIVDSNWDVRLNNVTINITIPAGANREDVRVFGHGPLFGESHIIDERNVVFTVPYVDPRENVETLVLFPPEIVPGARRTIDEEAFDMIMAREKSFAEEANELREEAKKINEKIDLRRKISFVVFLVLFVGWFPIVFGFYIKHKKIPKTSFDQKYYRELPGNYTPAEMSYLLNRGRVSVGDMTATLLDLVRRRYLILMPVNEQAPKPSRLGMYEDYIVSRNPDKPAHHLKLHEEHLVRWFINRLGDRYTVKLSRICDINNSEALKFKDDYENWSNHVKTEAEKHNFFEPVDKKLSALGKKIYVFYLIASLVLFITGSSFIPLSLFVLGMVTVFITYNPRKYTPYGAEQRARWMAFKNFLKDFSRMDKATLPSIVMWEHYLVYAVPLGMADKVISQLPLVVNEIDFQDSNLTYMRVNSGQTGRVALIQSMRSTTNSMSSSIRSASSTGGSSSSSSGSGGGFSGGSSGGGGGGGGGGAF